MIRHEHHEFAHGVSESFVGINHCCKLCFVTKFVCQIVRAVSVQVIGDNRKVFTGKKWAAQLKVFKTARTLRRTFLGTPSEAKYLTPASPSVNLSPVRLPPVTMIPEAHPC
jgi:hypothetical protein